MTEQLPDPLGDPSLPIDADWLREIGFRWHQLDRQPDQHWLLWMGDAMNDRVTCYEDLGIEVAPGRGNGWFCWLRSDMGGRYSRFIHLRQLDRRSDLIFILEGIAGRGFSPLHCIGGSWMTPEHAARVTEEEGRLDRVLMREVPWHDIERDRSRGGALVDHYTAYVDARADRG